MKSLSRFLLLALCTVTFLGFAGCSQRSVAPRETMPARSANATTEQMRKPAAPASSSMAPATAAAAAATPSATSPSPPTSAQSTSTDERLTLALKNLGARAGARGEVLQLPTVGFGPGEAHLEAGTGTNLEQVVKLLHEYPKALLLIDGYTDNRGSGQMNDRLSLQRAKSVEQALVADGLNASRLRTRGLGSADPIADNTTREGRSRNRRVELVFSNSAGAFASAGDQVTAG
jgi:OmpA-OmpF porin, OOP family